MYAQNRLMSAKLEQEFTRPVESVMKCEDFKSNFARKFSNRFISRSPVLSASEEVLEVSPDNASKEENFLIHVPDKYEQNSQALKNNNIDQNGVALKPLEKSFILNEIRKTEENALNMEVETLRWQLTQTEANRQMHIQLLRQIVSFLNKVKDHIGKSNELKHKHKDGTALVALGRSFNSADLPRSKSVLHVNNNEYPPVANRTNTRKISKSISNVNGYKDCTWNASKLSLIYDADVSLKIKEEMTRLITLADTVLSTKLPELACTCNDNRIDNNKANNTVSVTNTLLDENKNLTIKNNLKETADFENILNNKNTEMKENNLSNFLTSSLNLSINAQDAFIDMKLNDKKIKIVTNSFEKLRQTERKNDIVSSSFIEDESGFSSMNSFQEIGIPIISIIPPSPCQEMPYMDDSSEDLEESKEWKSSLDINDQNVHVFWV